MTLRVSISGPLLSGKTTLAHSLYDEYAPEVQVVPDIPREAMECLGVDLCQQDLAAFQNYIGFRQLIAETACEKTCAPLRVLDKSLLDALAYWNLLVGGNPPPWARTLVSTSYSLVVICDHSEIAPITNDVLRFPHMHMRDSLAEEVSLISSRYGWPTIYASGDKENRLLKVKNKLRRLEIVNN